MKKNKKWIHKEVDKLRIYSNPDIPTSSDDLYGQYVSGVNSVAEEVLGLINQLEEPEVLLQEENINIVLDDLKEYIKEQQELTQNVGLAHTPAGNDTYYRQYDYVLECIDEYKPSNELQNLIVPKQELPVIPKYVAEYIDLVKIDIPLMKILEVANRRNELPEWKKEYDWISSNDEMFARAWLDGYEVEEEPLYYALIKGHELVNDEVEWATKYWNLWVSEGCVFPYDKSETTDDFSIIMNKEDWNKYGINDLNADFIKVEKEEE